MTDGPIGPSVWAVSDGRAGNAAQVRALVDALAETSRWIRIAHIEAAGHRSDPLVLEPRPPWTSMPAGAWPTPRLALPAGQRAALEPPWPSLWIGAGRRTAPYTLGVREWSQGATFTVQILDPKVDPERFDLLVTPEHDEIEGANVIKTTGAPTYFSPDDLEETGLAFADLPHEPGQAAIVVLGGDSKTHRFTRAAADRLEGQLRALAPKWRLRITASRRTPIEVRARFRAVADAIGARYWEGPDDGPNPYLAWLMFSKAAIVTEDSANMLSDAAYFGLPIHIARLEGRAAKFDRLHQSLIDQGAARWFDGGLATWTYEPLREADRVADIIVERLLARHPQPAIPPIGQGQ